MQVGLKISPNSLLRTMHNVKWLVVEDLSVLPSFLSRQIDAGWRCAAAGYNGHHKNRYFQDWRNKNSDKINLSSLFIDVPVHRQIILFKFFLQKIVKVHQHCLERQCCQWNFALKASVKCIWNNKNAMWPSESVSVNNSFSKLVCRFCCKCFNLKSCFKQEH